MQCVNALFQAVSDPERINLAFGDVVDIAEVVQIEDGRFLTLEYIGPTDYFGECIRHGKDVGRRRGTNCISVDAAFLYKTSTGATELALGEWKFTESYPTYSTATPPRMPSGSGGTPLTWQLPMARSGTMYCRSNSSWTSSSTN